MSGKNTRMTKDLVPEGFTIALATVDAIPVFFFGLSSILLSKPLCSNLFLFGAVLSFLSGFLKVLWKYIVVWKRRNVWPLFLQMRILMPFGFLLMLLGFLFQLPSLNGGTIWRAVTGLPQLVFFLLGTLGMIGMFVLAFTLDSSNKKANWIEQLTNGGSQICFFIGILLSL